MSSEILFARLDELTAKQDIRPTFTILLADDPYLEEFANGQVLHMGNPLIDATPALLAAYNAGFLGVRLRETDQPGQGYYFNSAPPVFTRNFRISGHPGSSHQGSRVYRNYNEASATRGLFAWTAGYVSVRNIYLAMGASTTGGSGISVINSNTPGGSGNTIIGDIANVTITNALQGTMNYAIHVDGSQQNIPPLGQRTLYLHNVTTFGAAIRSVYLKGVVHFIWYGGSINQAGGTDGGLEIDGLSTPNSEEFVISIDFISDNLTLDRTMNGIIDISQIGGTITNTANTANIIGRSGVIAGAPPQNNWVNSRWDVGSVSYGTTKITSLNTGVPSAANSAMNGTISRFLGANGATARLGVDSFGTGVATAFSTVNLRRANGTAAAPSAIQSGDLLFGYVGTGFGSTLFLNSGGAGITGWASQTYTDFNGGTELAVVVTPNGANANAESIRFLNGGNIKYTNAANFSANGAVATVLGSLGPTGSHTTVQKWLTIVDNTGATLYVPAF